MRSGINDGTVNIDALRQATRLLVILLDFMIKVQC